MDIGFTISHSMGTDLLRDLRMAKSTFGKRISSNGDWISHLKQAMMRVEMPCLRNYARFENRVSVLKELHPILEFFDSNGDKELECQPFEVN
jgi:hypothetical protein